MTATKEEDANEVRRQQQSAADLIRNKLNTLYSEEPDAKEEISEVKAIPARELSKHQLRMKELTESGISLAEIQVRWHEYYAGLPDKEKHEVWQEFYSEHEKAKQPPEEKPAEKVESKPEKSSHPLPVSHNTASAKKKTRRKNPAGAGPIDTRTANDVKNHLLSQINDRSEVRKNPHVRSLVFGLSVGAFTLFFLLFGFFNERFITPFIRPNANVSATPIIVDPNGGGPVGPESKIIIPKINVEAPVNYDAPTIEEKDIQKSLESGVVHYITTPNPGEKGNSVIFGHSSSNILNKGKYKFAFLMLKSLEKGDTFIIQKDGKRYVYRVYNEFVTSPQDFSVLSSTDKVASVTLITCDPPGTSTNRLIIQAEQIFPDPGTNPESSVTQAVAQKPEQLPSNSVSMWQRIWNWL